jgi:enoyl-CoA hydratase/carnithine racemase
MSEPELLFDVQDKIATITFNRPDKLNAWTLTMDTEYRALMDEADKRDDVRVIVITGAGRAFCSGADMGLLATVQAGEFDDSIDEYARQTVVREGAPADFQKPYTYPAALSKPVVAAINGHAMGLGLVHAVFCDFRVASEEAKMSALFARRGLIAEHGLAWILPRLIGLAPALDLLLSGRTIDAAEALRLGLLNKVVPGAALMEEALALAGELATKSSPRSVRVIKRQAWLGLVTNLADAVDFANKEMVESIKSSDFAEALMAFIEKRPANFQGK